MSLHPSNYRVNTLLVRLRLMSADKLAVWVTEHAGQINRDEQEALSIHLAELMPWAMRRAW